MMMKCLFLIKMLVILLKCLFLLLIASLLSYLAYKLVMLSQALIQPKSESRAKREAHLGGTGLEKDWELRSEVTGQRRNDRRIGSFNWKL